MQNLRAPNYPNRKSLALLAVGLVAFILYLLFFGDFAGFISLLSTLDLKNYAIFYSLAILAVVLAVFFDSLIWYNLLNALRVQIRFRRIMLYNWIGNFVEMVIPCETVCGEATRIYLAQREPQADVGVSSATVISSRMLSTFVYTGGLIIGFIALALSHTIPSFLLTIVTLITAGTVTILAAILYLAFKEGAAEKLVNFLMRIIAVIVKRPAKQEQEKENLQKALFSFSEAFRTYRKNPRMLIKPAIFAVIAWFCNLMVYLMIFYSLGFSQIGILDLATVYCVASTVETLTAGFPVGAVEITLINLFSLYGVPVAIAVAATTLSRLITFWCQVLIGYPLINLLGLKPSMTLSIQSDPIMPQVTVPSSSKNKID
ncbi:MAG: flippase-like domain-containing protein [Candidatus Bathyarchaeota archaeon]|nr:flippase-like domain-containing protein [Candidatus Bathyarchaeota archaeon]